MSDTEATAAGPRVAAREDACAGAGAAAPHRRSPAARYGMALLATAGALLLRAAIIPLLGQRIPFLTFFPALTVSAWYGGFGPGLLCTLICALIIVYFLLEPSLVLAVAEFGDLIAVAIFIVTGVIISALNEALQRQRAEALSARVAAERALAVAQQAQRDAVAASRAKDEFLSVVSHELRTPLTSILGWANMLRARRHDEATTARALEIIERNARNQAQIVDDLLDIGRVIGGKLQLSLRPTNLADVVRAAIDVVAPAAAAKGVRLDAALAPDAGVVMADPDRLQQVVWNLLSNAIKFSPPAGRVDIRLDRSKTHVRLRVADTGEGIAPEFLPRVFERFTQAESAATRSHRGLGLGLAIAKSLVDGHGGTIVAESAGRGRGATFTVTLPIKAER